MWYRGMNFRRILACEPSLTIRMGVRKKTRAPVGQEETSKVRAPASSVQTQAPIGER